MSLMRWSPGVHRDLVRVHDEMDRLFDQFLSGTSLRADVKSFAPAVDVEERPEEFVLSVDLPGVSPKDVKVSFMGDTLTIRGERRQSSPAKDGNVHRSERVYGVFERSFLLGAPVRGDKVQASYRDGVLEIRVPKAEEARLREIEIQVA